MATSWWLVLGAFVAIGLVCYLVRRNPKWSRCPACAHKKGSNNQCATCVKYKQKTQEILTQSFD